MFQPLCLVLEPNQQPSRPHKLSCQDCQTKRDHERSRSREYDEDDADQQHSETNDDDDDALGLFQRADHEAVH